MRDRTGIQPDANPVIRLPLEGVHARPLGGVALVLVVVALAHVEEIARHLERLVRVQPGDVDGPFVVLRGPTGVRDAMAVTDLRCEVVLLDHLAHVLLDLRRRGNGCTDPRLEPVPERVEVAVAADAGVLVPEPGEYVADGAARQAAWALLQSAEPPQWDLGKVSSARASATPEVVAQYRMLRDRTQTW